VSPEGPAEEAVDDPERSRRALPVALVVLATLIGFVSVFALWAKRQALETDTWTETSTELVENETIRDAVADFLVTSLYDNVDVQDEIANRLPPQLEALAGPVAGGLRQLATTLAQDALAQPKGQGLWEDANRTAHQRLLALLDDEGEFVSTTGGVVTLDLSALVGQLAADADISSDVASKLPPQAASIEILKSDELSAAQSAVKALRTLAWVLTALALVLYAVAIALARGRRRETLRAVGFSFVVVGALTLFARNLAGDAVTGSLADTSSAEPAVLATWTIGTSLLLETAQSLIAYGVFIVLAAWLAGPTHVATSTRHAVAPYLRQPRIAYGGAAVLLVLLFWWDPVVATGRLAPSILLLVVFAIGVEALRRQLVREFPDQVTAGSPAGIARSIADRMREGRERVAARPGGQAGAAAPAADTDADRRLAQLERLAQLRDSGLLSEAELDAEKRRILSSP
jgi:hypothetical protein